MDRARARIVASGLVQGVGYRFFALRHGRALELNGYVRNTPSGAVELEVEGERCDIETFVSMLREGPAAARVSGLAVEWKEYTGELRDFEVGY